MLTPWWRKWFGKNNMLVSNPGAEKENKNGLLAIHILIMVQLL
jgi:hypothetical protein